MDVGDVDTTRTRTEHTHRRESRVVWSIAGHLVPSAVRLAVWMLMRVSN